MGHVPMSIPVDLTNTRDGNAAAGNETRTNRDRRTPLRRLTASLVVEADSIPQRQSIPSLPIRGGFVSYFAVYVPLNVPLVTLPSMVLVVVPPEVMVMT